MVDVVSAARVGGERATVLVTSASGEQVLAQAVVLVGTSGTSINGVAPSTNTSRIASAAASVNATVAKASPGTVRQASGYNAALSARYLRFYDTTGTPVPGTTPIRKAFYLPAASPFVLDMNDYYATGIAYALTTGPADSDTGALTAGDILELNVDYL